MSTIYGRNETLTNFARGISQESASQLANFIAPPVVTGVASGQFKSFNDKNAFQVYDTARAVGGKARRILFDSTDAFFNCSPNALEITIDKHERDQAGADQTMLEQAKTKTLVASAVLAHEKKVFDAVISATSAASGLGVWSGSTSTVDPISELDSVILGIAQDTGMMPNRMVIGLSAFSILRHNPAVKARLAGSALVSPTAAQIAAMLLNPSIEIQIGTMAYDTAKLGKTKNTANVVGANVFIFTGNGSPTAYDPSFAKTFTTSSGNIFEVQMYQEDPRTDVIAVDWSEDLRITSAVSGARIAVT